MRFIQDIKSNLLWEQDVLVVVQMTLAVFFDFVTCNLLFTMRGFL